MNGSYALHDSGPSRPAALNTSLALPQPNGMSTPMTPMTPSTPSGKRKVNPLQDLTETEKIYVDQLTGIIRKAASAWSRTNLPPTELDKMFRGIESVYKANRSLVARLNQHGGADPATADPKALGDLLMTWIEDLEAPYTKYCSSYMTGFDSWDPVQSNSRLASTLATFSALHPPPLPAGSDPHPSEPPMWTLDSLFALPRQRLKYYRKLYGRLLKSTQEGRSDHRLLVGAVERLDHLMQMSDDRAAVNILSVAPPPPEMEDEVVMDMRQPRTSASSDRSLSSAPNTHMSSSSGRPSTDDRSASLARASTVSTATISMPIADLERRLATDRTLDIFTMKSKSVRLQISPPTLTHNRELLFSADVIISVTPRATGTEIVHRQGHIYILSDLFLIGERMTNEERAAWPPGGPDTWLCYPPLAGKHLRLPDTNGTSNSFQITIMKKETLNIVTDSPATRDLAIKKFKECIAFAADLAVAAKARDAPPMPSLNTLTRPSPAVSPAPSVSQMGSSVGSPSSDRARSPAQGNVPGRNDIVSPVGQDRRFSPPSRVVSQEHTQPLNFNGSSQSMDHRQMSGAPPLIDPRQAAGSPPYVDSRHSAGSPQHSDPRMFASSPPLMDPRQFAGSPPLMDPRQFAGSPPLMDPRQFAGSPPLADPRRIGANEGGFSSVDTLPAPPRAPFSVPNRPGSAPLPVDKPLPRHTEDRQFSGGPGPQGFAPGQVVPGMGYGPGQGPGNPYQPGPSGYPGRPQGPGGMGPPPNMRPPGGPNDYNQSRNMTMPGQDPRMFSPGGPMSPNGGPGIRKAASSGAMAAQYEQAALNGPRPPMPHMSGHGDLHAPQARMLLPSALQDRVVSSVGIPQEDPDDFSPPTSPRMSGGAAPPTGPIVSSVIAQMKCKVFIQQHHQNWKSLGGANLRLFHQEPINVKQLVVEADDKKRTVLVSTIVLTDGVERVGKTGVAIELSDHGLRTGIVYMIQLKNETSAKGFFDTLLQGSDRRAK